MNSDLRKDLLKMKSDRYKQLLLKQDMRNIGTYERRLDIAYEELKDFVEPDVYKKIVSISDQLLQAVIEYTFHCFADMLAELDLESEEDKLEDD